MSGNVIQFPGGGSGEPPSEDEGNRTFLHCSNCQSAHFVVEVVDETHRVIRCGFPICEQVIEEFEWQEF